MIPDRLAFVDLETTGADPEQDAITEIGIVEVDGETVSRWTTLVNPGRCIPPFIEGITGISDAMVADAPAFAAIAAEVERRLHGRVFVAHNARFDYGFLRRAFQRIGRRFHADVLCTVRLSRRLFPEHSRHNLDSLIERHGLVADGRHRALADADLIWQFWQKLVRDVDAGRIGAAIGQQLARPVLPSHLPPDILDDLPDGPGVYALHDETGTLLHAGSDANLHRRVRSLFTGKGSPKALGPRGVQAIHRITWQETPGEFGARLLESQLARAQRPAHGTGRLFAWCLQEVSRGDFRPRLVQDEDVDPGRRSGLYGLFSSRREAALALRRIADAHRLCPRLLGLDTHAACAAGCGGVCADKQPMGQHSARLFTALARLRLADWPYPGPIGIIERDGFSGREAVHVFDAWRHLGTAHSDSGLETLLQTPLDTPFDPDLYRMLKMQLAKRRTQVRILRRAEPGPELP